MRNQSSTDLRADLKRLKRDTESARHTYPVPHGRRLLYGSALAIVLLALGFGFRWFKGERTIPHKALRELQLTHSPSENRVLGAAISPDGKHIAYADTKGFHLSTVETGEVREIPLPDELRTHLRGVSWFPDGEKLAFTADSETEGGTIWLTSVLGGSPRKLRIHSGSPVVSPQGSSIAFISGLGHEIWVMGANGENLYKFLASKSGFYSGLTWSPTGQRLAYIKSEANGIGGSIETASLNGRSQSVVLSNPKLTSGEGACLLWVRDGRMLFTMQDGSDNGINLWEIRTDLKTGKPSEKPAKTAISNTFPLNVSRDGSRMVALKRHRQDDVYVGELKENGRGLGFPKRLTASESIDFPSAWTSDGKAILFSSNRTGKRQIFRQQLDQESAQPLIQGPDEESNAQLSPDGAWILYWSRPPPRGSSTPTKRRIMRIPAPGGPPEQVLEAPSDSTTLFHCPFHTAGTCVLSRWAQGQLVFYLLDPVQGQGKELARTRLGQPADFGWSVSPDGSRIAIRSEDQLSGQVRILEARSGSERNLQLPHDWSMWDLAWSANGKALYLASQSTAGYFIASLKLDGKSRVLLDRGRNQWLGFATPSPDGRRLAFTQQTFELNVWLLENF